MYSVKTMVTGQGVLPEETLAIVNNHLLTSSQKTFNFPEFVRLMTNGQVEFSDYQQAKKEEAAMLIEARICPLLCKAWGFRLMADELERSTLRRRSVLVLNVKIAPQVSETYFEIRYKAISKTAQILSEHRIFVNFMTLTICAASALVGIQTELSVPGNRTDYPALAALDAVILAIFTLEIAVKVIAEGTKPLHFFQDNWNKFDFFIVAACFVFLIPELPNLSSLLSMLRLLRLLRVLKLVKAIPELRIIIEALIAGFGSMTFVTIILFMFYYIFAIIGMLLFRDNDKEHFGNLQMSLISLFRIATFDNWTDLVYLNVFGCNNWFYQFGRPSTTTFDSKARKNRDNCNHPSPMGWISVAYFVTFCIFGSHILLTLFVGVVATAMGEATDENSKAVQSEQRAARRAQSLGLTADIVEVYRDIFNIMDTSNEKKLNHETVKQGLLECLRVLHTVHLLPIMLENIHD